MQLTSHINRNWHVSRVPSVLSRHKTQCCISTGLLILILSGWIEWIKMWLLTVVRMCNIWIIQHNLQRLLYPYNVHLQDVVTIQRFAKFSDHYVVRQMTNFTLNHLQILTEKIKEFPVLQCHSIGANDTHYTFTEMLSLTLWQLFGALRPYQCSTSSVV